MATKPVLGYWDVRGRAEYIRNMLVYLNVDFEDKLYPLKIKNFEESEWFKEKCLLGLDFPNLPYYIDGDVKLTQSLAIMRHIARKYKLDGNTEEEKLRITLAEHQLMDFFDGLVNLSYNPNCESLKPDYLTGLPNQIKLLSSFLGDRPFLAGKNISYVDFFLCENLVKIESFVPGTLAPYDNLNKFVKRIQALPRVSEYIKSLKPSNFHSQFAKWDAAL